MTKIKFSTSQFLAALALAAAIGLMIQAININPASALEGEAGQETSAENAEESSTAHVNSQQTFTDAMKNSAIETIVVDEDFTIQQNLLVNRDITIDLNGHKITNSTRGGYLLAVVKGHATVKNGILENTADNNAVVVVRGASTDEGAEYSVVEIGQDVQLIAPNGTTYAYGAMVLHNAGNHSYGAKIIFDGKMTGGEGIYVNGNIQDKTGNVPEIVIGDHAQITTDDFGIYAAGYAKWTIGRANITAGDSRTRIGTGGTGIGAKAGVFTLNGATIAAHGSGEASGNNNGMTGAGAVFQIENNPNYAGDVEFTVNSGNYSSQHNSVFHQHETGTQNLKSIKITGGTFSAGDGKEIFSLESSDESSDIHITGGTFNRDVREYLDGDWQIEKDANGNWVVSMVSPDTPNVKPTQPGTDGEQKPTDPAAGIEIPDTGVINKSGATNAIASISLVVSMFVAVGVFYNRFKIYRRVAAYVPNPSVDRVRKK